MVANFLFVGYFFLCRICIVGMGNGAVEERGALQCGIVIGNMKFLSVLDRS